MKIIFSGSMSLSIHFDENCYLFNSKKLKSLLVHLSFNFFTATFFFV